MRVLLATLLVSSALAYDAVIFSNDQKISRDFPTIENILSTASVDTPVVFLVNPDFTLGQFSAHAKAYSGDNKISGLPATVKGSKFSAARGLSSGVHAPSAFEVTSADAFQAGAEIYIVAGQEWTSLDKLANEILPKLGNKYTAVITASEAVSKDQSRVKRVATDEMEAAASPAPTDSGDGQYLISSIDMPLNIPPYNRSKDVSINIPKFGNCMLYAEGVNIVVMNTAKGTGADATYTSVGVRSGNTTWGYKDGDAKCANSTVGDYIFTVRMTTKTDLGDLDSNPTVVLPQQEITFTLFIVGDDLGYWQLVKASIGAVKVNPGPGGKILSSTTTANAGANSSNVNYMGMQSVQGWAFGCSDSQAVFFPTDNKDVMIGISLYNTQIQPYGVVDQKNNRVYFTLNVDDCTGTFSPGSWMAIISSLVLLAGFFFGFLMLNSVKTMDRFDDPKQKQIVINVRE